MNNGGYDRRFLDRSLEKYFMDKMEFRQQSFWAMVEDNKLNALLASSIALYHSPFAFAAKVFFGADLALVFIHTI